MANKYILSIDQSTQGTKGLLLIAKKSNKACDIPHKQIIDDQGYVEHNPNEILKVQRGSKISC